MSKKKLSVDLQAIVSQGEKKDFNKKDERFPGKEVLKKMFTPIVDKTMGEKQKVYRIRLLPNPVEDENRTPFLEVEHHVMRIHGRNTKLVCPSEVGRDCVLCDVHGKLWSSDDETDKENSKKYRKRTFYIVRVIDRANEGDGVKFWRFAKNYKGDGIFDKIKAKIGLGYDVLDPHQGRDLDITASLDPTGRFTIIQDISQSDVSPLASTEEGIDDLINDDVKWHEVFKVKDDDYLEDVINGKVQYWDDTQKKYITPGQENENGGQQKPLSTEYTNFDEQIAKDLDIKPEESKVESKIKASEEAKTIKEEVKETTPVTPETSVTNDDDGYDDDLPF